MMPTSNTRLADAIMGHSTFIEVPPSLFIQTTLSSLDLPGKTSRKVVVIVPPPAIAVGVVVLGLGHHQSTCYFFFSFSLLLRLGHLPDTVVH